MMSFFRQQAERLMGHGGQNAAEFVDVMVDPSSGRVVEVPVCASCLAHRQLATGRGSVSGTVVDGVGAGANIAGTQQAQPYSFLEDAYRSGILDPDPVTEPSVPIPPIGVFVLFLLGCVAVANLD